ncbi:SRPBCC family protein (plasmid) [Mycolicibacterium psychrotolerans]|uniref:SRPBCC family protein n=1 Tax=Mycolicibacterium psychrotolerans TaxID=216929 RepID=UPI003D66AC11
MQIENSFKVPVGVDEAWAALQDIERIAPCMPGAELDQVDGDEFTGTVRVKLGPVALTYRGSARFAEKDVNGHRAVIEARARDARGNGTAKATITATLAAQSGGTEVRVLTDLDITGKPAQFGRGVIVDVGNKLIGQFADRLALELAGDDDTTSGPVKAVRSEPESIDLAASVAPALIKRLAPAALVVLAVVLLVVGRRRSCPTS